MNFKPVFLYGSIFDIEGSFIWFFQMVGIAIMEGLCWVLYFCEQVFWTLVTGFKGKDGKPTTFIEVAMNGEVIQKIILGCIIAGFGLLIAFCVVAVIRQYTNNKEEPNPKAVPQDVLKGIILMIAIPALLIVIVQVINAFTNGMVTYLRNGNGLDGSPEASIANWVFKAFGQWKDPTSVCFNISPTDIVDNYMANWRSMSCYQFLFAYFAAFVLLYNLAKAVFQVGKRCFDVALLYAVSPMTVASYPIDQGKRWDSFMNIFISKLLNVLGIIFAYFIYIAFNTAIMEELGIRELTIDFQDLGNTTISIAYIVLLITGGMAMGNAPGLLASLISDQAGAIAREDAAAIDSDIKWGTMMAGKAFGAQMKIAKGLYEGTIGKSLESAKNNKIGNLANNLANNKFSSLADKQKAFKDYKKLTGKDFTAKDALKIRKEQEDIKKAGLTDFRMPSNKEVRDSIKK